MYFLRNLVISIFLVSLFHTDKFTTAAEPVLSFIHDLLQYNIAGIPLIHERTEWDFDPEVGKQRRARYEEENGRYGELAIAKIGMGIGYKGPWGTSA
ncbi:PREDICTED: uncharacterized protein LOC108575758 [Habropoda laboriosa]|uniref:uncharacterized protein LOC108575758 n=1 Tax=Habropoda laboriosa TaxID=597456 RepID=UPI00083E45D5|nr:PREDICTED: uncharacterized protein LOC108575758 [Habropoda laboriosa]